MDIISLLITVAGIFIILVLYFLNRISRNKLPKEKDFGSVPRIVDENGELFTSLLEDIPATDGIKPRSVKPIKAKDSDSTTPKPPVKTEKSIENTTDNQQKDQNLKTTKASKTQHILFISGKDEKGLDGNKIDSALLSNGLLFGEMDIYHFMTDSRKNNKVSLFRVANGVDPWTLRPQDLKDKYLPGLSLLLVTPSPIDNIKAIETFIRVSEKIAQELQGELKNAQQQKFSLKDKEGFLQSLSKN